MEGSLGIGLAEEVARDYRSGSNCCRSRTRGDWSKLHVGSPKQKNAERLVRLGGSLY
jgi:hypothetical protein